jgi:hypothetical protein
MGTVVARELMDHKVSERAHALWEIIDRIPDRVLRSPSKAQPLLQSIFMPALLTRVARLYWASPSRMVDTCFPLAVCSKAITITERQASSGLI